MPINKLPIKSAHDISNEYQKDNKTNEEQTKLKEQNFELKIPIYTFDDMILPNMTQDLIENTIASIKYHDLIFNDWGLNKTIKQKKGVSMNFYGHSGTGKTMAAHAVANFLNLKVLQVNYADIESKYVGETAKNLTALFKCADSEKSLLLFDEADALLSKRVTDMRSSTDVSVNQTRSVLLTLLDEYTGIVIFTTNFISNFDSAFMRRISAHIQFFLPDYSLRMKLWKNYIPLEMPVNINIEQLAENSDGLSGSDITNCILNAAYKAARLQIDIIPQSFFEESAKNILTSKSMNEHKNITIEERYVTKEYVENSLNEKINGEN